MTSPEPERQSIAGLTATNLQAIPRLASVPPDRLRQKVGSTFLGALFGGIGLLAFGLGIRLVIILLTRRPEPPALPGPSTGSLVACGVLGAVGVALMLLGAAIADFEVVKNPILFIVAVVRGVSDAIRGKGGPNG